MAILIHLRILKPKFYCKENGVVPVLASNTTEIPVQMNELMQS